MTPMSRWRLSSYARLPPLYRKRHLCSMWVSTGIPFIAFFLHSENWYGKIFFSFAGNATATYELSLVSGKGHFLWKMVELKRVNATQQHESLVFVSVSVDFDSQIFSVQLRGVVLRSQTDLFFVWMTFIRWYLSSQTPGTYLSLCDKLQVLLYQHSWCALLGFWL